jgi:hypothetical protein
MNKHAQALGRMAKGKRKAFSAVELERRRVRLSEARAKRWKDKQITTCNPGGGMVI